LGEITIKERLATLETKIDTVIDNQLINRNWESQIENRVRCVEKDNGIFKAIGLAAWAIILIVVGKVFGKLF
jgi:hypothetical protein